MMGLTTMLFVSTQTKHFPLKHVRPGQKSTLHHNIPRVPKHRPITNLCCWFIVYMGQYTTFTTMFLNVSLYGL